MERCKSIISTPQGLENDVISNRIKLNNVSLITFDECHRATGDYSYVWIAKQYEKTATHPKILGLTASPGSDMEKINEILDNLFIEEIELKTDQDPDVKPYIQEVSVNWINVNFPEELKVVQKYLKECMKSKLAEISRYGYLESALINTQSKMDMLKLQGHLQGELANGNRDFDVLKSLSLAAEAMKVQHAIELVETQGLIPLNKYIEQIQKQATTSKTKAVKNLARDLNFRSAFIKTQLLIDKNIDHPKINKLKDMVTARLDEKENYKMIVFTQYRDTGNKIVEELNKITKGQAKLFVGQAKKRGSGLTQKEQIAMLDDFRNGNFNVLVSSSVGEEGLDIPQVDSVIFYEPIPSAIRHIQRRGRTGRLDKGEVSILVTKGTRDEGYRWSAHHKEKRMFRILETVRKKMAFRERKTTTLNKFIEEKDKFLIYADHREKGSGVIKELIELGAKLKLEKLESADYILGTRAAVEFKVQEDFVDSIIDGRLMQQVNHLRKNFERPVILVEGNKDIFSIRNIHPNAIRGIIASIAVDFGIPIIYSRNFKETASMLMSIAKREQAEKKGFSLHGDKKPLNIKEQQEYVISSLPGIGHTLAKPLLMKFRNIKNIINAEEKDLKMVNLIGEKKASKIKELLEKEYEEVE